MQQRILWVSGVSDRTLDECKKNKDFNLDPNVCLPMDSTLEEFDLYEPDAHD